MNTINFTAEINNSKEFDALVAFMNALKIKFEISNERSPYNKDFVNSILNGELEVKKGKVLKVNSNEFDDLWK